MAIKLFEHNRIAYEAAVAMLIKKKRSAIIHPAGTGKSFIGFKLCEDNPDKHICWLSPSRYIFETQLENLKSASNGWSPKNIRFCTYAELPELTSDQLQEFAPDYIVLYEFHSCSARMWGAGVQRLLNLFENVPVLGLSVTAVRRLDSRIDMADKLFDGKLVSEITPDRFILSGAVWDEYYSAAADYYSVHRSLDVSERFVTKDGVRLGAWLEQLRIHRKSGIHSSYLTPERIEQLDRLGMLWEVYDYVFERSYHAAVRYYREHGDLECGPGYVTDEGIRLGAWLQYLRAQYKKNRDFLTAEQYDMLSAIGMRWGNKYDLQWNEAYSELCEYYRRNRNIAVPVAYATASGLLLGRWIRRQIELYAKGRLRPDRTERLEKLGIVWEHADPWEEKFRLAKAYSEAHHGISDMPDDYVVNGIRLNKWLNDQRLIGEGRRKKMLTPEQREKLESIGLVFGTAPNEAVWQELLEDAKKYYGLHDDISAE